MPEHTALISVVIIIGLACLAIGIVALTGGLDDGCPNTTTPDARDTRAARQDTPAALPANVPNCKDYKFDPLISPGSKRFLELFNGGTSFGDIMGTGDDSGICASLAAKIPTRATTMGGVPVHVAYPPGGEYDAHTPRFLFLHGGGLTGGRWPTFQCFVQQLVAQTGHVGVHVDYRVATEENGLNHTGILEGIVPAVAHALRQPYNTSLVGLSAGGNLATALVLRNLVAPYAPKMPVAQALLVPNTADISQYRGFASWRKYANCYFLTLAAAKRNFRLSRPGSVTAAGKIVYRHHIAELGGVKDYAITKLEPVDLTKLESIGDDSDDGGFNTAWAGPASDIAELGGVKAEVAEGPGWDGALEHTALNYYWARDIYSTPLAAPASVLARMKGVRTLVEVAGLDPQHDEGVLYARKLAAAGVPVALREYPSEVHDWQTVSVLADAPNTMDSVRATAAFLTGWGAGRLDPSKHLHVLSGGAPVHVPPSLYGAPWPHLGTLGALEDHDDVVGDPVEEAMACARWAGESGCKADGRCVWRDVGGVETCLSKEQADGLDGPRPALFPRPRPRPG